ncbi:MaoC family dehydratase [Rhodoferax sp.]|uniref:MaoC family dehydratase n=1 Tax=Rhodoferax sp. TaxID=50421 RepID=UPI0027477D61|nr:MaoC/PaaZ C-terminal domain-containing protein [Rhodoferax sp.]
MPVIRPPAFWSTLVSTAGLLRHAHPGLADPAALPRIERTMSAATLDPVWLSAYRDSIGLASGSHDTLAPLTLQIAAAPLHLAILADAGFPFRSLGLVHMTQGVTQTRAIAATAVFDLLAYSADARWEKRGMSFCLVTEARCDGELVWQARTRALAPGKSPGVPGDDQRARDVPAPDPTALLCEQALHVPESRGRRYAALAGDLNPIHQHALLARPFGFERAIMHGTWTLARALVMAQLPRAGTYHLDARFRRPVTLPCDIMVRAWATAAQRHTVEVTSPDRATPYLDMQLTQTDAAPH